MYLSSFMMAKYNLLTYLLMPYPFHLSFFLKDVHVHLHSFCCFKEFAYVNTFGLKY